MPVTPACAPEDTNLHLAAGGREKVQLSEEQSAKLMQAMRRFLSERLYRFPATVESQLTAVHFELPRFDTYRTAGIEPV